MWFLVVILIVLIMVQIAAIFVFRHFFKKSRDDGKQAFMEIIRFVDFLTRRFLPVVPDRQGIRHLAITPDASKLYHEHELQILKRLAHPQYVSWATNMMQKYVQELQEAADAQAAMEESQEQ